MDSVFWALEVAVRWVRLKIYQYEVTFAVYMLTPTEKFIFNFLLFSLITMLVTGAYVYLPDHARAIYGHLYYYWVGERPFIPTDIPLVSSGLETGSQTLEIMYETAKNAATTIMRRIA
ncbi:hypothetical protein MPDQ_001669 [Monascus purpureus]|uniref:Uncharacterized protein n=1 Tax=Monascus purpureus TaxID=5098 RepID=A0A507QRA6_MONPU|nr:hypothetical protein MPDQ_001669 [Monascus purpureus]BDD61782.1 hypothetical protein MAP00_006807 [Monascus purpureus]